MKSVKDMLGQVVGRGGRPAIVDMTVDQVRELDPDFCTRLQAAGPHEPIHCGPYLHRTVGQLAEAEHVDVGILLKAAQATPSGPPEPAATDGHRVWPGPRLAAPVSELDLTREIERLRSEPAWQQFDRNAKTLVKNPELRIVLMALKPGARLDQHQALGAISIQVLSGRVRLLLPSERVELTAGELVAVSPTIRHDLEALESSAVLLTIALAPGQQPAPPAASRFHASVAHGVATQPPAPERHFSPDGQAMGTEADLRPNFDTEVRGHCFAPIEGYMIVKSGSTDFRHHGWYVVDEPYAGMKPETDRAGHPEPVVQREGARIPGQIMPGEVPVDTASRSLIPPSPEELGLRSSTDASYPDLRHLARGGPHMASR
jgi:quercetin dioxygenase-like cupin family protein